MGTNLKNLKRIKQAFLEIGKQERKFQKLLRAEVKFHSIPDPMFDNCWSCRIVTMLVETANIFNNFNFNWPAGLHLWSNSKGSSSTTTTTTSWTIHIYVLVYWIVGPSILGPLLEEHDDRVQQPI